MRIGVYVSHLLGWHGGRDFAWGLYESLMRGKEPQDDLVVLHNEPRDSIAWRIAHLTKHFVTKWPWDWDWDWIKREPRRVRAETNLRQMFGASAKLSWLPLGEASFKAWARTSGFDAIGPFGRPPNRESGSGWIGYLADCQHRRLPHFFAQQECEQRDQEFSQMLQMAAVIVVNSRDTKNDLLHYFDPCEAEIIPLPFSAAPDPSWFDIDTERVRDKYEVPKEFLICSNQFWAHKNHRVVFEALHIARARGHPMFVVFTGATQDYRDPAYFERLMRQASALGVTADFKVVGLIPKQDQIGLMRAATAVLQPTLFEGGPGGGAAYDAISVGRPIILSDLPVNREIATYAAGYFEPSDARSLCELMWKSRELAPHSASPSELIRSGEKRRAECGRVLRAAYALAAERAGQRFILARSQDSAGGAATADGRHA